MKLKQSHDERNELFVRLVMSGVAKKPASEQAGYKSLSGAEIARIWNSARVQEYVRELRDKAEIRPIEVLKVLRDQMHADIGDLHDEEGRFDYQRAREYGFTKYIKRLRTKERKLYNRQGELEGVEIICDVEIHDSQKAAAIIADITGMKTAPKLHPDDMKELRELTEQHIEKVMEFKGFDRREQAVQYMVENQLVDPKYVM